MVRGGWFIFSALALALSGRAFSFPENVRHGYPSCAACHVSPTGGGALSAYGRGASEAFMASWAYEGEAEPLHSPAVGLPEWLMVGGDQRAVVIATPGPDGRYQSQTIPMQADLELAAFSPLSPMLTLDVSGGVYGPERRVEYRRFYLKAMLSPTIGLKSGRFLPAFGINVPDHTTATRTALGLGEGAETYGAEAFWLAPRGELIVDAVFGQQAMADLNDPQRVGTLRTDDMVGWTARGALYASSRSSVGASGMWLHSLAGQERRDAGGLFAQVGLGQRAFVLTEADRIWDGAAPARTVSLVKVGVEAARGLVLFAQGESLDGRSGGRLGLQWQPRPHFELQGELRMADAPAFGGLPRNSLVALVHHWL